MERDDDLSNTGGASILRTLLEIRNTGRTAFAKNPTDRNISYRLTAYLAQSRMGGLFLCSISSDGRATGS